MFCDYSRRDAAHPHIPGLADDPPNILDSAVLPQLLPVGSRHFLSSSSS